MTYNVFGGTLNIAQLNSTTHVIRFRGCRIQMLSEFFREQRALLWLPNRQNKPQLHKFQFCIKYWEIFHVNSRVLGVSIFTYIIGIFNESKKVTMATEFKQTSAKIALISVLCKQSRNFNCWIVGFSGSAGYAIIIFNKQTTLPRQPNLDRNMWKLHIF